jgi:hypothetical protein
MARMPHRVGREPSNDAAYETKLEEAAAYRRRNIRHMSRTHPRATPVQIVQWLECDVAYVIETLEGDPTA